MRSIGACPYRGKRSHAVWWTTPLDWNYGSVQGQQRSASREPLLCRARVASISCLPHVQQRLVLHSPSLVRPSRRQGHTKTGVLSCTLQTRALSLSNQMRRTKRGKLLELGDCMWSAHQEAVYLSGNLKQLTTGSEDLLLQAPVAQ